MIIQQNIAQSFQSPIVRVLLGAIAIGAALCALEGSAEDPRQAVHADGHGIRGHGGPADDPSAPAVLCEDTRRVGIDFLGMHFGIGIISGFIVAAFTFAQLLSAPMWGRFSDRVGRRPTLLIALGASGIAYLIFGFAHSLLVLFLSRLVQGAGGGTVGVIQAYVADSTDPKDRARAGMAFGDNQSRCGAGAGARFFRDRIGQARPDAGTGDVADGARGAGNHGGGALSAKHDLRRALSEGIA